MSALEDLVLEDPLTRKETRDFLDSREDEVLPVEVDVPLQLLNTSCHYPFPVGGVVRTVVTVHSRCFPLTGSPFSRPGLSLEVT